MKATNVGANHVPQMHHLRFPSPLRNLPRILIFIPTMDIDDLDRDNDGNQHGQGV